MGDDDDAAAPNGEADRSPSRTEGEASDADVRAAVESVGGEPPERTPTGRSPTAGERASTEGSGDGSEATGPPDAGRTRAERAGARSDPDPDLTLETETGTGTETDADADADPDLDPDPDSGRAIRTVLPGDLTPTAAAVGGIGLVAVGVLVVVSRALLASGAGLAVAALYGVGGLLIVGGFVAHALGRGGTDG